MPITRTCTLKYINNISHIQVRKPERSQSSVPPVVTQKVIHFWCRTDLHKLYEIQLKIPIFHIIYGVKNNNIEKIYLSD